MWAAWTAPFNRLQFPATHLLYAACWSPTDSFLGSRLLVSRASLYELFLCLTEFPWAVRFSRYNSILVLSGYICEAELSHSMASSSDLLFISDLLLFGGSGTANTSEMSVCDTENKSFYETYLGAGGGPDESFAYPPRSLLQSFVGQRAEFRPTRDATQRRNEGKRDL